jgi:hypothetical protein
MKHETHETLPTLHTAVQVDIFSHLIIFLLLVIVNVKKHIYLVNCNLYFIKVPTLLNKIYKSKMAEVRYFQKRNFDTTKFSRQLKGF